MPFSKSTGAIAPVATALTTALDLLELDQGQDIEATAAGVE